MEFLLLCGARGSGKSTRVARFRQTRAHGGFRSWRARVDDRVLVFFQDWEARREALVIGRSLPGRGMQADREGLRQAAGWLASLVDDGRWVIIDEIGWLEGEEPQFLSALFALPGRLTRMLLVLRREKLPHLERLKAWPGAVLIDLETTGRLEADRLLAQRS